MDIPAHLEDLRSQPSRTTLSCVTLGNSSSEVQFPLKAS